MQGIKMRFLGAVRKVILNIKTLEQLKKKKGEKRKNIGKSTSNVKP
jgi:hypothetical protein